MNKPDDKELELLVRYINSKLGLKVSFEEVVDSSDKIVWEKVNIKTFDNYEIINLKYREVLLISLTTI